MGEEGRAHPRHGRGQRSKLVGRGGPVSLRLAPDLRYGINNGQCALFDEAGKKPIEMACPEVNFFPGLFLFGCLANEAGQR